MIRVLPYAAVVDVAPTAEATRLMSLLREGAFTEASTFLGKVDTYRCARILWCWADLPDALAMARTWTGSAPGDMHGLLLLGFAHMAEGLRLRGDSYFHDIPEDRQRAFPLAFESAHAAFLELADHEQAPALAYFGLIQCDVIARIGPDCRDQWFGRAMAITPFHQPSVDTRARASMAKWGGSDEEMWKFLQWVSTRAPRGSDAHATVACYVLEWALPVVEECESPLEMVARIRQQVAGDWMRKVLYDWLDAGPDDLEQRLRAKEHPTQVNQRSAFALMLYLSGAWEEARVVMRVQKGRIPVYPWHGLSFRPSRWFERLGNVENRHAAIAHDRICRDMRLNLREVCGPPE